MRSNASLVRVMRTIAVVVIAYATCPAASAGGVYWLNEGAGVLSVIGSGRPPVAVQHQAQARLLAERAAIVDAYGAVARLLSEAVLQAVTGAEGYSIFLRGGQIARSEFMPDGSVRVELEIPISPKLIRSVRGVMRGKGPMADRETERAGLSHDEFVTRHSISRPRVITQREWTDRYQTRAWVPDNR
ncbi:MAG: hypothetical protein KGJ40_03420 [candidate division NC10 bacterium]|nr:hypothetical protein [candidate division NC10 bacterium]